VIPEILVGKPELREILARLDLSAEFDLFSSQNLVPTHRRCNLAKTSDIFNEASARFFLHRAEKASANVKELIASKKKRESREDLLSTVGEAIRSGLILPMDLQESQPPDQLRLTKPLVFADNPNESVESISAGEVEGFLDRPVLIGGNPVFAADFGDDSGVRMTVRTCRDYRAALAAGFYAKTTYDIKSEAFLKTTNAILTAAALVPELWKTFGQRISQLTGSPRLATNPPNAVLNYCYCLLENEARLAASSLGLDPVLGVLHADTPNRDSLALDIMEAVRPCVDVWLLDWLIREQFSRSWFFETATGNCRLMSSFASELSKTAPTWGRLVAPWAEYVAHALWAKTKPIHRAPATRLTQTHRREAKSSLPLPAKPAPQPPRICRLCGTQIQRGRRYCALCTSKVSRNNLINVAHSGRIAAQAPEAQARRAATKRRQDVARRGWLASSLPAWLNNKTYLEKIQPRLAAITYSSIASALNVSQPYAADIRAGKRIPHPRHWQALAQLAHVSPA
jgi:hypothetical protein